MSFPGQDESTVGIGKFGAEETKVGEVNKRGRECGCEGTKV